MKPGDRVRMSAEYLRRRVPNSTLTEKTRGVVVSVVSPYLCNVRFDGEFRPTSISTMLLEPIRE